MEHHDRLHDAEDRFCDLPGGIRLCYRLHGEASGTPLVLVAGLGLQLNYWPASLVAALVRRGYRVLLFDNRDVGRSSRLPGRPPGMWQLLSRRAPAQAYDVADMAGDLAGLMDALDMRAAHVVGMSMGGMIAQELAARAPGKVLSLTSIFSTTGARSVGGTSLAAMLRMLRRPPRTEQETVAQYLDFCRYVGPSAFVLDEADVRAQAHEAWRRGGGAQGSEGVARQLGAILKSGDRTASVRQIRAPTLVIHGDVDRLVHPSGGRATARAIAGAVLVFIHGMGHYIGDGVSPWLVDLIDGHARRSVTVA